MAVDIDLLIKAKAVLGTAQAEITKFLDGVEKQTEQIGKSGESSGSKLGMGIKSGAMIAMGAITAFAGVVASATAAVVALGARGAGLDDTRQSFAQLTKDVGGYEASLQTLRKATDGIVSDTQLMESTNKAFSLGLRLTQDQMQLTGETARILADRVGVDTAEAYKTLTQAMATGMDRQLKSVGLNIDAKKAVDDLARSLGVEAGELNESQQIMAKKNAILAAMRVELEETGRATVDFADRLDQIKVGVQNFNDNLAVAIATSPVVNEAMGAIADAIQGAFGANQQQAVQTITGYVNSFAIFLVDVAQVAVSSAKYIVFAWQGLKMLFSGLMTVIFALAEGVNKSFAAILEGAAKIPGVGKYYQQAAADARDMALQTEGMRKSFQEQTVEALDNAGRQAAAFDNVNKHLGDLKGRMVEASKTQADASTIAKAFADRQQGAATAVTAVNKASEAVSKKIREMNEAADLAAKNDRLKEWAVANSAALMKLATDAANAGQKLEGNLMQGWIKAMGAAADTDIRKLAQDILKKQEEDHQKSLDKRNENFIKSQDIILETLRNTADLEMQYAFDAYTYKEKVIERERDMKIAELKSLGQATAENLSIVQGEYEQKMFMARVAHDKEIEKMKASQNSFANMSKKWAGMVGDTLIKAFTGGGGASGAFKALGTQIGGDIFGNLFQGADGKGGLGGMISKSLGGTIGKGLGGVVGMLGGPIGSMLGSVLGNFAGKALGKVGGFLGGLFGKDSKETKQIKESTAELTKLYGGLENIRMLGKATGVDMEKAFSGKGKKGLEELTKQAEVFKKKVAELKAEFGEWADEATAAHVKLPATLTPYLAQLEKMGLLTAEHRAELEHWSQDGVVDIEGMKAAADKYGISLAALGPAFQQGVANQGWQEIIDHLAMFKQGGADMTAVIAGMGDEISKLVQDSIAFGTTIPMNMKPWIETLIASGQLLDENGNKITDINTLSFGDPLVAALDKIIARFDTLLQGLGLVPKALDAIPNEVNVDINVRERRFREDGGVTGESNPEIEVPGAAAGGLFSKPTFRVVGEAGPEVVGAPNAIVNAFAEAIKQNGGMGGGGAKGDIHFNLNTQVATVDSIRQLWYDELGPVMLQWLADNRGGSLTTMKEKLGVQGNG
jgi:hypothetical protein